MSWLASTWLVVAAACVTLAVVHLHVWMRQRDAAGHAAFALLAVSVAWMGFVEVAMVHADSPGEFGRMLWWYQVPVWSALVALVCFIRFYLRAGRAWLGWTAIGLRTAALAVNFAVTPVLQYTEITSLHRVDVLGDTMAVAEGTPRSWLVLAHLSLAVLVVFVADATHDLWRRGERRRAVTIGGSVLLFVTSGMVVAILSFWGVARVPVFVTLLFIPIVLAMAYDLGVDLTSTVRLSNELGAKTLALRGSEQRAALAAEAANAGLWSVDRTSGRLWATPRALAMFGLAPGRDHHVDDVIAAIHPDDRERVRAFASGAPASGGTAAIEYRVASPSGPTRWYASLGRVPAEEPDGSGMLMGATIDISERKAAEDEAARQRAELEHLSRVATVSELSGALAHEINQPLAIIMSNAEAAQRLLAGADPDLAEVRAILDDVVSADERAGEVIRRLREHLKHGASDRQPLSLNELVEGVLQFLRADLIRRGATVEVAFADDLPRIRADRVPLEQVLINILGNACDAMAANAPGDRAIRIATSAAAGMACVHVTDRGCGLPAEADRVFAPFYTTKEEGLGLGLAISRSIVTSHGGRLWAEASRGRGATFHIELPAAPP